ncbi:MAG: hypothetical protein HY749_16220 [Gammaproteobacteria bacterium]|nr:hypothetical protein [Gammaproteobacteria bacterium]
MQISVNEFPKERYSAYYEMFFEPSLEGSGFDWSTRIMPRNGEGILQQEAGLAPSRDEALLAASEWVREHMIPYRKAEG